MGQAKLPDDVFLAFDDVALRDADRLVFRRSRWTWRPGEQWAILGPNGAGQSLLARAIAGEVPVAHGEIRYSLGDAAPEAAIVRLAPESQRALITAESSFYQARWHSGVTEGERTVKQFLSPASVEQRNRFEVGNRRRGDREFGQRQRDWIRRLGIEALLPRKLIFLSNGEQRRVLLVHALLRSPRVLILEHPYDGLDVATRRRLQAVIHRLMHGGRPVVVVTSRPDELPPLATHLLLVDRQRIVAQGAKADLLRHPLVQRLAASGADGRELPPEAIERKPARGSPNAAPLVELNDVTVRTGGQPILRDVRWTVRRGERWVLLGPNGSGKTTLLSLIQGDHPQAYALDLRLFGRRPHATHTVWRTRQRIGWLSPELHLHHPAAWSCLAVVCSGFFNSVGLFQSCTPRQRATARRWLREFGLDDREESAFGELAHGDQRLVLLARAAVKQPDLLVLDEACQGLDAAHRAAILDAVDRLIARTNASLIFVTHHTGEWPRCVTHRLRLRAGRVVEVKPLAG